VNNCELFFYTSTKGVHRKNPTGGKHFLGIFLVKKPAPRRIAQRSGDCQFFFVKITHFFAYINRKFSLKASIWILKQSVITLMDQWVWEERVTLKMINISVQGGKRKRFCCFKGRVHCFSMQVVMNKCFPPNPEKILLLADLSVIFEKNALQFQKMTSPIRKLGYSNYQLNY